MLECQTTRVAEKSVCQQRERNNVARPLCKLGVVAICVMILGSTMGTTRENEAGVIHSQKTRDATASAPAPVFENWSASCFVY